MAAVPIIRQSVTHMKGDSSIDLDESNRRAMEPVAEEVAMAMANEGETNKWLGNGAESRSNVCKSVCMCVQRSKEPTREE